MIELMRAGRSKEIIEIMPSSRASDRRNRWRSAHMADCRTDFPTEPAILHGYGTVIGTGNAIVEWPISRRHRMNRGTHPDTPAHLTLLAPDRNPGWGRVRDAMSKPSGDPRFRCGSDHPLFHPLAVDHRPPDPSRPQPSMEPRRSGLPCPWDDRLRSEDRC